MLCNVLADRSPRERATAVRQLLDTLEDEAIFDLAQTNQVAPQIAHALLDTLGDKTPSHWYDIHESNHKRLAAYLAELDTIAAGLAAEGITIVALKNGGIARGIYPCPGCCPMGDLDTLVELRHFRQAHNTILSQGYQLQFRSALEENDIEAAIAQGSAEYCKILPDGEKLWVELLWRPVDGRWIRPDQEPRAEEFIARSISIPGTAVRLLSPEDNLLQVCLHTAKHTYVRAPGFRLHTDVDRIVCRQTVDWDVFLKRAIALQVKTAVYFSLAIPAALFDTPIPQPVLAALKPAAWKEHVLTNRLNKAGLFNPHEKKFGKLGYIVFNMLLYDDLAGLMRSIFPSREWMKARYRFRSDWLLPFYHLRRLIDLTFRRMQT
ncbi:MAG: nucleotidyltransferase family protein [Anaerolineae bacterium]|nr:nucleotidyltransferase family protein [Anaerolineae bacterium]